VVAEDYSLGIDPKQEEEEQAIAVVNEHDYVEVPAEGGEAREAKRPRLSEEVAVNNINMQENYNSTIKVDEEKKPVLQHHEVKQEAGQVSVIRRLLPAAPQQKPTDLGRVIQDTIGGDVKGSIVEVQQAVQQIQQQEIQHQQSVQVQQQIQLQVQEQVSRMQVVEQQGQEVQIQEQTDEEQVDIEKLVDFCFEEELQRPNAPGRENEEAAETNPAHLQSNKMKEVIKEVMQQEEVKRQEGDKASVRRPKVIQRVRRHTSGKKRRQSGSPLPLKKRRKMHHYPIAMAINRQQVPNLGFTIEEEFRLHDLVVRNDHIQSITHQELMKTSPESVERMMHVYCGSQNIKVKIQEADMDKVCNASRELFASKSKEVFDEFHTLKRNLAYRVQYTNWPALQCIQFATFLANKGKGLRCQMKFCGISDHLYEEMKSYPQLKRFTDICDSQSSLGLGMENYDMFSSPWALTLDDELFFEKTLKELGTLLGEDQRLMVVFQMLVMATQPPGGKPMNKKVKDIQGDLAQLLYRYLASKHGTKLSSEVAYKLTGFINKMHRCGDIFMNRRIKMLPEEESSTSSCSS